MDRKIEGVLEVKGKVHTRTSAMLWDIGILTNFIFFFFYFSFSFLYFSSE